MMERNRRNTQQQLKNKRIKPRGFGSGRPASQVLNMSRMNTTQIVAARD